MFPQFLQSQAGDFSDMVNSTSESLQVLKWCKPHGRLAQLDRVQASEAWGRGFESHAARQLNQALIGIHKCFLFTYATSRATLCNVF